MKLLDLFLVALMPVLKVLLFTGTGTLLAIECINILGVDAQRHLNDLVFYVLNPALVGSNLANYITSRTLAKLWFMPVSILINFIMGTMLGWLLIKTTRARKGLQGLILGCCAAGSLGNMPLIIVPAVCKEKGSTFGDANICYTRALAYASLSMAIGSILIWTYVYNIVQANSKDSHEAQSNATFHEDIDSIGEMPENLPKCHSEPIRAIEKVSFSLNIKQRIQTLATKLNLKSLFAPSTIGAIVGFIIGIIPPFRKVFIGDHAPLQVVEDFAYMLGEAAIPIITLIVGVKLVKGFKGSNVPLSIIMGIITVRYIILPLFGIGVVKAAIHLSLIHRDPLYEFVLLIQFALPPAINIGTMTQKFGVGEDECSVIMLWTNLAAIVAMTFWSAFFLWLIH